MEIRSIETQTAAAGDAGADKGSASSSAQDAFAELLGQMIEGAAPSAPLSELDVMNLAPTVSAAPTAPKEPVKEAPARSELKSKEEDSTEEASETEKDPREEVRAEPEAQLVEQNPQPDAAPAAQTAAVTAPKQEAPVDQAEAVESKAPAAHESAAPQVEGELVEGALLDGKAAVTPQKQGEALQPGEKAAVSEPKTKAPTAASEQPQQESLNQDSPKSAAQDAKPVVAAAAETPKAAEKAPRKEPRVGVSEQAQTMAADADVAEQVLKEMDLPKGSPVQEAVREQLAALLRPHVHSAQTVSEPGAMLGAGSRAGGSSGQGIGSTHGIGQKLSETLKEETAKKANPKLASAEQDKAVEKVKELLKNASASRNGNTLVVRLDPPSLGMMTMRVTHKAGEVFARIIPESSEVEAALRTKVPELMNVLTATGISPENVHISIGAERVDSSMMQFGEFLQGQGGQNNGSQQRGSAPRGSAELTHGALAAEGVAATQTADAGGWVA